MKKMIYVMHVNWNWIKQRPHFIAEKLSEEYDVTIFYPHVYKRKGLQKRGKENFNTKRYYWIPKIDKFKLLRHINPIVKYKKLKKIINFEEAEYLFLTFPDQVDSIPTDFKGKLLYDCMDNHIEFISDTVEKSIMESRERRLIDKSNKVLVSSVELKNVLIRRYGVGVEEKIYLVRNGYSGDILSIEELDSQNKVQKNNFVISYFGTISHWFNFEFIEKSLSEIENLEYDLIGPSEVEIPKIDRLNYKGTIEHHNLYEVTKNSNCYIMPFELNPIIESVDPVKLYEYINFNKNILTIRYNEIERFDSFVHFYTDYESFIEQIRALMATDRPKYSISDREIFLSNNRWDDRVQQIIKILES